MVNEDDIFEFVKSEQGNGCVKFAQICSHFNMNEAEASELVSSMIGTKLQEPIRGCFRTLEMPVM